MSRVPLKTQIRSALRRIWMYSDVKKEILARARVARGVYRCAHCAKLVGNKMIKADHLVKVTPDGFDPDKTPRQWGEVIERMLYITADQGQALCKPCHDSKTKEERRETKTIKRKTRKSKKKKTKRSNKLRAS